MDFWNAIAALPGIGPALPYIGAVGVLCAVLATMLPPPGEASGATYRALYALVNWAGLNLGHARNAGAVRPPVALLFALAFGAVLGLSACSSTPPAQRRANLACLLHTSGAVVAVAKGDSANIDKALSAGAVVLGDSACLAAMGGGAADP